MLAKKSSRGNKLPHGLKTWIEINSDAVRENLKTFRKIVGPKTKIWSVVKSNAYGHGLYVFAKLADKFGADGFCVDSVAEGLRLREKVIKKPILVLGPTLPDNFEEAAVNDIAISVSDLETLNFLGRSKIKPNFHLKIDTGMHRRGFYIEDLPEILKFLGSKNYILKNNLKGVFTHFASAKDINYPTYTEKQFAEFQKARSFLEKAGYKNLVYHAAATGGVLLDKKYHLDAVRLGIGLYGLWPSKELRIQLGDKIFLRPVLSWHTVVAETKNLKKWDYVGYDLSERVLRPTQAAVLPIGYWHGFPRSLSSVGNALINGRRARVLGKISMDMMVVDVTDVVCRFGNEAILIGPSGKEEICAEDAAALCGTTHYEFLTRINPLIERIVI